MDDLISRQAAIGLVNDHTFYDDYDDTDKNCLIDGLRSLPPAQPKRGKWIDTETSYADGVQQKCRCSVCARLSPRPLGDFCRWCGADMRGDME